MCSPGFLDDNQRNGDAGSSITLSESKVLKAFPIEHAAIIHGCAENERRGHWTEVAHTVAANALYKFLKPSQAVM